MKRLFAALARLVLCGLCLAAASAGAREAAPLVPDEATESRLVALSSELRCLVCQNESLAASQAELANDLKREIRAMIVAGKSDAEIMDFLVTRYGDFVRYRPALKGSTLLLWFGPAAFLVGGLGALAFYLRRRNRLIDETPLTPAEAARAEALLEPEKLRLPGNSAESDVSGGSGA